MCLGGGGGGGGGEWWRGDYFWEKKSATQLFTHIYRLIDIFSRMREKTDFPNRPAHLRSAVWIVAAQLVSDCDL